MVYVGKRLQSLDFSQLISENGDINKDWLAWKSAFLGAVSKFVPTKHYEIETISLG
jgi:hypothetical protein